MRFFVEKIKQSNFVAKTLFDLHFVKNIKI